MPIKAYIVDDDMKARERITFLIDSFLGKELKIIGQSGQPREALKQIFQLSPDIIFLDVEMPQMTGLELAQKLQTNGFKGKIIFVTSFDQYSIKAIRTNAFDYILKPIDVDILKEAIDRYKSKDKTQFSEHIIQNFDLSEREVELVSYLAKGLSSEEVATEMFLSRHTVDTHRRNIHLKTGTKNIVELLILLRN